MYTIGGSFWEFGEPDWERSKLLLMFGLAEDHDSNPIKIRLSAMKRRGAQVDLDQSGAHRLFGDRRRVDRHPAGHRRPFRAVADPRAAARRQGRSRLPRALHQCRLAGDPGAGHGATTGCSPATTTGAPLVLDKDGAAVERARRRASRCAWSARRRWPTGARRCRCSSCSPSAISTRNTRPRRVAATCGVPAATIRRSPPKSPASRSTRRSSCRCRGPTGPGGGTRRCAAGRSGCMRCAASRRIPTASRPAARCTCCRCCSARSMCRAAGATSRRIPKPCPPGPKPAGKPGQVAAGKPLAGAPLGYPMGPEDLILDADGNPHAHRQGVLVGGADRRARHDAHGDQQRLGGRSLQDRHALHVHGQHGVELGDEHRRDDAHADRQGRGRRATRSRTSSIPTRSIRRWSPMPI